MAKDAHTKAAERHENADKAHRMPAKHHGKAIMHQTKIEPFRKFQYSDTFFKPGLEILTGIEFGAMSRTKYRSHKKIRVEGEIGVDTRDISYAI